MTALHWAAFHGRAGHVKVLVARNADVLTRDTEGKLPLHWAAQNGSLSSCQEMLQVPDSHNLVNGKDFCGRTPIHLAAAAGQFKVLVELTKVTFVNHAARDNENRTPLHWAAATGHGCCVAHLLRLGTDREAEDCHGATPLQYAQQGHHSVCCKLILEHDPSNPLLTQIPEETVSASADNLQAPPNSGHGSDNTHPAIRLQNGLTNTHRTTDASDSEVQEILSNFVDSTATVQVHVEMNGQDEPTLGADFLYPSMNGIHSDHDAAGYSSEEDCRYPPQMVLTPVPGSPIPPENVNHNSVTKPPILPRFSFEDQALVIRPSGAAVPELAPIKSKTMPERLRLNIDRSNPVKSADPKPSSPSMETHLGPLKVVAKAKQGAIPLSGKPQPRVSPTTPREVGSPDSKDNGKDRLGARKSKVRTDALVPSPVSDNNESDTFRKVKDKRPSAGSTTGQILPVISDKSSHVTQVTQGSRQDQLDAKKRNRRNPSKNSSIPEDLDVTGGEEADDTVEDARSVRSIGNSKDKKKKKKVRKVMSWNF